MKEKCEDTKDQVIEEEPSVCPLCLGWLEYIHTDECRENLYEQVRNCGYQYARYSLTLTVTVSTVIRECAFWLQLKKEFGSLLDEDLPFGQIVDLKEATKWVLGPLLDRNMKMTFIHEVCFLSSSLQTSHDFVPRHRSACALPWLILRPYVKKSGSRTSRKRMRAHAGRSAGNAVTTRREKRRFPRQSKKSNKQEQPT
jgi:hypothetical protein